MPIDAAGYWYPELASKQLEIYNSRKRYILASGPKKSGKTLANLHRIIRHAVEVPNARIGMFAKTVKNAKAGGIWNDILEITLPEWFRMKTTRYTTRRSDGQLGPKQDAQTRMMFFKIRNQVGGEAEFQLHSIDNENEVEAIAKGTRFSCFYFSELSNFRNRLVFDITSDQLRMHGLAFEDHLWIADTNPSDEGEDSWIYKLWYEQRVDKDATPEAKFLQRHLELIEVMIPDNPYLDQETIQDLYARFSHDPDLYARYILGKWVRASKDALFIAQFKQDVHVLGNCQSLDENAWEIILPQIHCNTLITGWDLGDRFHSAHIIEPIEMAQGRGYCVLDEINHLTDENMGLEDFAEQFMERYDFWVKMLPKEPDFRHWSDAAALNNYRAGAEGYDKNLIYRYTDGKVLMRAAPKFPGSIRKRINLVKTLLFENRLYVSARCFRTIEMLKSLRSGTRESMPIAPSKYRHVFDSLSYALAAEEPSMLMQEILDGEKAEGRVVSLALAGAV